ncbi:hypothetical protein PRK78_002683 [Emydomyces testavorans]|uniref:6-phosphogluconolactonase n=1 Tax=Emydomyces testavorans TaxID=2070801 RepID=A0AAF0II26_9EURO|nr:hypothetical protein PRK78_002683 [Emydomyces testavorans]
MKSAIILSFFLQSTIAQRLAFVGTYGGSITTVQFDDKTGALKQLFTNKNSAPAPSWQEVSANQKFLYTIEETSSKNQSQGALTSYSIKADGQLNNVSTVLGMAGPVNLAISPDQTLIFTANYGSASVSAYSTNTATGELSWLKSWERKLSKPGVVPDRQEASHPHQAVFESTGKFVLVPDLGADIIRMFSIKPGPDLTELDPIKMKPGSGPRHGVFYPPTGKPKFYFLVSELDNTVTVFSVEYGSDALKLAEVQSISTLPANYSKARGPAAGEIVVHPNSKYVYVSNRLEAVFPNASSIASYEVDASSGHLKLLEIFNSGVMNLRHLSIHPSGKWLITEGQNSNNMKSFKLDPATGKVEQKESSVLTIEKPACLQWLKVERKNKCSS